MIKKRIRVNVPYELTKDPRFDSRALISQQAKRQGIAGRIIDATMVERLINPVDNCMAFIVDLVIERSHGRPYAKAVRKYRRPAYKGGYV